VHETHIGECDHVATFAAGPRPAHAGGARALTGYPWEVQVLQTITGYEDPLTLAKKLNANFLANTMLPLPFRPGVPNLLTRFVS
jgi:hypothetical protein